MSAAWPRLAALAFVLAACGQAPPREEPAPTPAPAPEPPTILVPQIALSGASSIAWHPDGRHVAVGAYDVIVVDADEGTIGAELPMGSPFSGVGVAWSGDGRFLVALSHETLRIWETESGAMRTVSVGSEHVSTAPGLAVSRDGAVIAGVTNDGIRLWSSDGTERGRVPDGAVASLLALSEDGQHLAWLGYGLDVVALRDGVPVGEARSLGVPTLPVHGRREPARDLVWDATAEHLALAEVEETRVFALGSEPGDGDSEPVWLDSGLELERPLFADSEVPALDVRFEATGGALCMAARRDAVRWPTIAADATASSATLAAGPGREYAVATARAIDARCRRVVSGDYTGALDIVDRASGALRRSVEGRGLSISFAGPGGRLAWRDENGAHVLGPDGHRFFAHVDRLGFDASGNPWRHRRGGRDQAWLEIDGHPPVEVSAWGTSTEDADRHLVAFEDANDGVQVIDTATATRTDVPGPPRRVAAITESRLLLERDGGGFALYDRVRREVTPVVFPRRHDRYALVELLPDATRFAVVDHGMLTLYDAATMRELRREPAGGGRLDFDWAGEPVTWPAHGDTGRHVVVHGETRRTVELDSAGMNGWLSPDRRRLAVSTASGRVWVIDLEHASALGSISLGGEVRGLEGLRWSPDGARLAIGAQGSTRIVDVSTLREVERFEGPGVDAWLSSNVVILHSSERVRLRQIGGLELELLGFEDGSLLATMSDGRTAFDARAARHVRARRDPSLLGPLEPAPARGDPVALYRELLGR